MIALVAAMDPKGVIGLRGYGMPWGRELKEDLARFRKLTHGHTVVMGRKTFTDDIKRPLPGRRNIVISRDPSFAAEGCEVYGSLQEALASTDPKDQVFVIGGAEIYKLALPLANEMFLTVVFNRYDGDVYFPEYDTREWNKVGEEATLPNSTCPGYKQTHFVRKRPDDSRHVDVQNAYTPEYRQTLERLASAGKCPAPFCQESAGHHAHGYLAKGRHWKVTRNSFNYQEAKDALLFIHKQHVEHFTDITPEAWLELREHVVDMIQQHNIAGGTIFMRFGDKSRTGASVTHLHAHLVAGHPREAGGEPIKATIGFRLPEHPKTEE